MRVLASVRRAPLRKTPSPYWTAPPGVGP